MNFYNNIVPLISFPENTFYSNDTVTIPSDYDFYNKYVKKVLLPYENNNTNLLMLLDQNNLYLKQQILNEIGFYKINNFTFNYNRSFFYNILKKLSDLLTNLPVSPNRNIDYEITCLQIIELLKEQIILFNEKLDSLNNILDTITGPINIQPFLTLLHEYLNGLNFIITNIIHYERLFREITTLNLSSLRTKITTTLLGKINRINQLGRDNLSQEKQDQIKEYFSIVQLLNELFEVPDNIDNIDKIQRIEQNVKTKFNSLYSEYKLFNKIYREKDLQIITTNFNEPNKRIERNELLKIAINNKKQLFGYYKPEQYKRVFLPYYISFENIIDILKLKISNEITQDELDIFIYNYNTFFYEIIFGDDANGFIYIKYNRFSSNKNYFKIPINYIYEQHRQTVFTDYNPNNEVNDRIHVPTAGIIPLATPGQIKYLYIPITQPINKIYDNAIKKFLFEIDIKPRGESLKIYNKQKFTIKTIYVNLQSKGYSFNMVSNNTNTTEIVISLYDLIKNEVLKERVDEPLKIYYTDYKYSYMTPTTPGTPAVPAVQDININILTFYEDIYKEDKIPNSFGSIQNDYNLYILLEQFKKQIKLQQPLQQPLFIEDLMLCLFDFYNNYILKNTINPRLQYIQDIVDDLKDRIINPLKAVFPNTSPNPLELEIDYYYANEKSKEIIYKESRRGVVMIRLIVIILYIARIYFENSINYFDNYTSINNAFNIFCRITDTTNRDSLINNIIQFFDDNRVNGKINENFLNSIIDGSLFSKNKQLFTKKQNKLETSIETASESIEHITSEMDKFIKLPIDPSLKGMDVLKDAYDKVSTNVMDYFKKEPDYTNTPINITDFEEKNFSLTADVIQNRVKKWITGPIYKIEDCKWLPTPINPNYLNIMNDNIVCPDVVQFVSEYLNNKSGTDLVSVKNKEQICKNISLLKNTIEKNTSEIQYILPKTFFDDEQFITTFSKKLDNNDTKISETKK